MSSVDDRIVNMQFNSKQFTQGATDSQKSLDGLEKSLTNAAKSKGLDDMGKGVDGLKSHFSAMEVAGVTAIATIANKAVNAGLQLVRSFTLDPLKAGFSEYQTNLNSIQTVMANTGKGIKPVQDALNVLNAYSDKTIYNFSEMAKNVGTFTAAGVDLKTSTSAIQGIANLAALSGSNSQQASTAMYQLSQAIAAGRVNLQDWNSVVNAGMGGKQFQTALAQTAVAMGTLNSNAVKLDGNMKLVSISGDSFRNSISAKGKGAPWLSSKVLTTTLASLDGQFSKVSINVDRTTKGLHTYTDAQLDNVLATNRANFEAKNNVKFTDQQFDSMTKMADAAFKSATQIKTLPQLVGVVQESLGSIWSSFFSGILGNFTESVNMWTAAGDKISSITRAINSGITNAVDGWRKLGGGKKGRFDFVDALSQGFTNLGRVMSTIKDAFRQVFPPDGTGLLVSLTTALVAFVHMTHVSAPALESLHSIFMGVFSVLHIGVTIIKAVVALFGGFFGEILKNSGPATGGILSFAATIGDLLVKLDKFISQGGNLVNFFHTVGAAAGSMVGEGLSVGSNFIFGIINGLIGGSAFDSLKTAVENIGQSIVDWIKEKLGIHSPAEALVPVGQNIVLGIIKGIQAAIGGVFGVLTGLISGIGNVFKGIGKVFSNMFGGMNALDFAQIFQAIATGFAGLAIYKGISGISNMFQQLTNTFQEMQTALKAEALKAIAIAIGLLVLSVIAMQFIDKGKVIQGTVAIGALLAMMTISMKMLSGMGTSAIKPSLKDMAAGTARILALGTAMVEIATAIAILSGAVVLLGRQKPETLKKGLAAMAVGLATMVLTVTALSALKGAVFSAAAGMVAIASAMLVLSTAVLAFGLMKTDIIKKGLTAIAIGLGIFVVAIGVLGAVGPASLAGGLSIALVAGALMKLIPVILILGVTPWSVISKGMKAMAIGLGIVLAAGALAIVVSPGLLALALVLGALGIAFLGAGIGMTLFATGFALLTATGIAGVAVMSAAISAFITLLPAIAVQIAAAFVSFLQAIALAAPKVRAAMSTIIKNIIGVVLDAMPEITKLLIALVKVGINVLYAELTTAIPKIGKLLQLLVDTALKVLKHSIPAIANAGMDILVALLKGIADHIPDIAHQTTRIIVAFIKGIGNHAAKIVTAAAETMLGFLNALDAAIVKYTQEFREVGLRIAGHILDGMSGGLISKAGSIIGSVIPGHKKATGDITFDPSPAADKPKPKEVVPSTSPDGFLVAQPGGFAGRRTMPGSKPKAPKLDPQQQLLVNALGTKSAKNINSTIAGVVGVALRMANKISAKDDPLVLKAATAAAKAKIVADQVAARQFATKSAANRIAKSNPKLSKAMLKSADAQQKAVDAAKAKADAAAQRVTDAQTFRDADNGGKGDIKNELAQKQADRAAELMTKANAEAAAANKLMKTNRKAGLAMLAQAKKDAAAAKNYAAAAEASHKKAQEFYALEVNDRIKALAVTETDRQAKIAFDSANDKGKQDLLDARIKTNQDLADSDRAKAQALITRAQSLAKTDSVQAMKLLDQADTLLAAAGEAESSVAQDKSDMQTLADGFKAVTDRITQFEADRQKETDDAKAQAELDNAGSDAERAAILQRRATADQQAADAKNAEALGLIEQAKAIASTDAAAANKLIDQAEALVSDAKDYADKAKSEADSAKSLTDSTTSESSSSSGSGGGGFGPSQTFTIIKASRTILEDAANSMDRYTASLASASALAAAGPSSVKYEQNVYSPTALSASDVYRQSKNLIAANSVKMGGK